MWHALESCPINIDVLLAFPDEMIRIGQRFGFAGPDSVSTCKVVLDMGDAAVTIYCPHDYQPTHWAYLPTPPQIVNREADASERF